MSEEAVGAGSEDQPGKSLEFRVPGFELEIRGTRWKTVLRGGPDFMPDERNQSRENWVDEIFKVPQGFYRIGGVLAELSADYTDFADLKPVGSRQEADGR